MILINRPLTEDLRAQLRAIGKQNSPFSASWAQTQNDLEREVRAIHKRGTDVVLMMDVDESQIRIDGGIKANARPYSDNVALAIDTRKGPLIFPCGRFYKWQDNVRAIALGMEALRKIERYGIAPNAEQYRGWQALPPGTPMPAASMSIDQAARLLLDVNNERVATASDVIHDERIRTALYRQAAKDHHPDVGGSADIFRKITEARDVLEATA